MTIEEHIVAWIESSGPHYAELLELAKGGQGAQFRASEALRQVKRAYTAMVQTGDAWDHGTSAEICRAAAMLCEWEAPE